MTVITRYIVERNGEEKMHFANKKDADAYDKELDIAEAFQSFIAKSSLEIEEASMNELSLFIAKNRDEAQQILKGVTPKKSSANDKKNTKDKMNKSSKSIAESQASETSSKDQTIAENENSAAEESKTAAA